MRDKLPVAEYLRRSTEHQQYSLENQHAVIAAYAEARSLYKDAVQFLTVSAGTGDRQDQITYASAKDWGTARLGKADRTHIYGQRLRGGGLCIEGPPRMHV